MEGKCCPTGAHYEPGEQVKKAKSKNVATSEEVVDNILKQ